MKCEICGKEYRKGRLLRLHFARNHVDKSEWVSKCSICGKVYADEEILRRHMKNHEKKKIKITCPVDGCERSFIRQSFLDKHLYANHPENTPQEIVAKIEEDINNNKKTEKEYKCSEPGCISSFGKHHLLTQHSYVHTNILPFQCGKCDKRFLTLRRKKQHEKVHNGYACASCDEVLPTWTSLRTHVARKHRKEYKCEDCDKIFLSQYKLTAHAVIHAESRQIYQCTDCDRTFTRKHAITKHFKVYHEGIKQYECPFEECKKRYAHKQGLKRHIVKVHHTPCEAKEPRSNKSTTASRILGFDMKTFKSAMDIS